jgi:hypothetical protein
LETWLFRVIFLKKKINFSPLFLAFYIYLKDKEITFMLLFFCQLSYKYLLCFLNHCLRKQFATQNLYLLGVLGIRSQHSLLSSVVICSRTLKKGIYMVGDFSFSTLHICLYDLYNILFRQVNYIIACKNFLFLQCPTCQEYKWFHDLT